MDIILDDSGQGIKTEHYGDNVYVLSKTSTRDEHIVAAKHKLVVGCEDSISIDAWKMRLAVRQPDYAVMPTVSQKSIFNDYVEIAQGVIFFVQKGIIIPTSGSEQLDFGGTPENIWQGLITPKGKKGTTKNETLSMFHLKGRSFWMWQGGFRNTWPLFCHLNFVRANIVGIGISSTFNPILPWVFDGGQKSFYYYSDLCRKDHCIINLENYVRFWSNVYNLR